MARDFIQLDEFRRRAKAGEFVSGKDAGVGLRMAQVVSAAIDPDNRTARYRITDATVDRSKDVLDPAGGKFDAYGKNPVFLWAHDYTRPILGKCVELPVLEKDGIYASFKYKQTPFAEEIWQDVLSDSLRAVSIGFVPIKWSFNEDRGGYGVDFEEWELIEVSQVPVPCNPNALLDDGKGIAVLEAFVKDLRSQTDARRKAKENTVAIITIDVSIPDGKDAKSVIAELDKKAKNLGASTAPHVTKASDAATDDDLHAQMAEHAKAFGEQNAALAGHVKSMEACAAAQDAHVKALGALVDAVGSAMEQGDGKGFSDALAKALAEVNTKGGAHKLSASQLKSVKSIAKAASEMQERHHASQGATDGEPDEPDEPKKDDEGGETEAAKSAAEPAAPPAQSWLDTEAQRLGITTDDVIAELTQREIARAQGRLD